MKRREPGGSLETEGLSIRLLGDTVVKIDGEPIAVDTRKAVALLVYLVVTGTGASRDQLSTLLWSDLDPDRARGALRRTLSVLRKALGGRWLEVEGGRIGLAGAGDIWVDSWEVDELVSSRSEHGHDLDVVCADCRHSLQVAADLHRGEFMGGFTVREAADFDGWQRQQADGFRRRRGRILALLADSLATRGEFAQAAVTARARVDLEPLDEAAHRQAMVMSVWAGDRAGALRQYRQCVRTLDEELGVPPLPETSDLEDRILCDDIPQPPTAELATRLPPSIPDRATETWPTVGRTREQKVLAKLAAEHGARSALVTGVPGVGKTRLLDGLAVTAANQGRRIVRARAYEGEEELGLVLVGEAVRAGLATWGEAPPPFDDVTATELSRLLPHLIPASTGDGPASLRDPGAQSRFTDAVCSALATLLGPDGILILDDLQSADPASLDLIAYLLRRTERFPVGVVLAWRSMPPGEEHPLERVVTELMAREKAIHIVLSPLAADDMRELALQVVPNLEDASAEALVDVSDGIPLVALEYLTLVDREAGVLAPDSLHLAEVAEARLRGLDELARQVLAAASVIGRPFELEEARAAGGRSDDETTHALETLVGRGLLDEVEVGRFDFRHDLVRQHARRALTPVRHRLLHSRLADHLIRHHGHGPNRYSGRIAHHLEQSRQPEQAAAHRAAAATHARSVFAHKEAMAHYEAALALGHPDVVELHRGLGDLHTLAGDYTAALDAYRAAASRADGEVLAKVEHRLGEVNGRLGRFDLAERHFQRAREGMTEADSLIELLTDWARLASRRGDDDQARQLVESAAQEAASDADVRRRWPVVLILQGIFNPDADAARAHVERGLEEARRNSDPGSEAAGLNALARLARGEGDLDEAIGHVHAALRVVQRIGDRHRQATFHDLLADLMHEQGDEEASMAELTRAVEIFADIGTGDLEPEIWKSVPW